MNDYERYLFDLQGFVVVEQALMPEQVTCINSYLDDQIELHQERERSHSRFDRLVPWGKPFRESSWSRHYYSADDYPDLTDSQRHYLKPPGVYS